MAENGAATEEQKPAAVNMRVLGQYIRDMSFENILAQKGLTGEPKPEISVQVNLDAKKRGAENQYEVIIKLNIESKSKDSGDKLFLLEIEYAGLFHVENVPQEQLHPFLMIECPRMIFPFLRRVVSDVTRDGGFPPLNLETIDFMALYRAEIQRRVEAQKAEGTPTPQA
ncbi:protein-export chaperone SecB [Shimia ponticola]|uniref:protein-export chaperone SecB n=1 Tax=Shimia ponticola TaxID=2582893 RepID=UPI0011BD91AD|nr:protein-export chaperone SecB [Shimia ponticola]